MGIQIGCGGTRRNSQAIAVAGAEAVVQAVTLGPLGFSNAISAFFRSMEALRGEDDVECRADTLVMETLAYAVSATIAKARLGRKPEKAEVKEIIEDFLLRAQTLAEQQKILLEYQFLSHPDSIKIFNDAAGRIHSKLSRFKCGQKPADSASQFREAVSQGLNRIRARNPNYFNELIQVLTGPDAISDARARAWEKYRTLLIRRFEDSPLFGEDENNGIMHAQVYQPLRAWWNEEPDEVDLIDPENIDNQQGRREEGKQTAHVGMLETLVLNWLDTNNDLDRIRLISGGPGSGKSTFAKRLAAVLAPEDRWRTVFVPLQRLKGTGPLETRIDEYFRLQQDEPFDVETLPVSGALGRDGHPDWLFIFDGLDELAKEGSASESAAQEFALALLDWRGRIAKSAAVRFVVLGRAPSMQEARRRLSLHWEGTLHVADMRPIDEFLRSRSDADLIVRDPDKLATIDQRAEFWARWAVAKGLSIEPPEAMQVEELSDLTKEPLLAYLLIMSGYVSERWQEAAENRNQIYRAIFREIWNRERNKISRARLNELGQDGFNALMQALGLAAWRGGGRTGDEATFTKMRDIFMGQNLLTKAKECGVANLDNIAILFYTQKDEGGGRGYEFLHKSFGEYLTACGLFSAFLRWGEQVDNHDIDFNSVDFLRRWLGLAGAAPITYEILSFLNNEAGLIASETKRESSTKTPIKWTRIAADIVNEAIINGLPAHEDAKTWRAAETSQRNAELSLLALLNTCARNAYPRDLKGQDPERGGWEAAPVNIPAFKDKPYIFKSVIQRISNADDENLRIYNLNIRYNQHLHHASRYFHSRLHDSNQIALNVFSHLNLDGSFFTDAKLSDANMEGASFVGASLMGAVFFGAQLGGANFNQANMESAFLVRSILLGATLKNTNLGGALLSEARMEKVDLQGANLAGARLIDTDLRGANLRGANLEGANLENADLRDADLRDANIEGCTLNGTKLEGANMEGIQGKPAKKKRRNAKRRIP